MLKKPEKAVHTPEQGVIEARVVYLAASCAVECYRRLHHAELGDMLVFVNDIPFQNYLVHHNRDVMLRHHSRSCQQTVVKRSRMAAKAKSRTGKERHQGPWQLARFGGYRLRAG